MPKSGGLLFKVVIVVVAAWLLFPMLVHTVEEQTTDIVVHGANGSYYIDEDEPTPDADALIQQAIDSLPDGRTLKEKILLKGNFVITQTIELESNIILELDGTLTCSTPGEMLIYTDGRAESRNNIEIHGGKWIGTADTDPCIYFRSCNDISIHDIEVTSFGGGGRGGVAVNDCNRVLISNNILHDGTGGVISVYNACTDVEVAYNTIYNTGYQGIFCFTGIDGVASKQTGIWIHHNNIARCYRVGITLYVDGYLDSNVGTIIEYNNLLDCSNYAGGTMIAAHGGLQDLYEPTPCGPVSNCIIRYNTFRQTVADGDTGGMISVGGDHFQIYGNEMYNSGSFALAILNTSNSDIHDNLIEDANGHALLVSASVSNKIHDNTITGAVRMSIAVDSEYRYGASNYNIVSGNTVSSPRGNNCCIYIGGPEVVMDGTTAIQTENQVLNNILNHPGPSYPTGIWDLGTGTIISGNVVNL